MLALKDQFAPRLRRANQVNEEDAEKVQCDDELFNKFREGNFMILE